MITLSDFETAILSWIAERSNDSALQDQLTCTVVTERDYTEVGCYSILSVPSDVRVSTGSYVTHGPLEGPYFQSEVMAHGGGTLQWFKEGRVQCLEIYAHGDYFPSDHSELGQF